ncbi:hypothetical protein [Scytonema sp. NUACC26]|uniref:hypothetical protein n=1 Tax=Scytonema sp. NUACC26 TaxID=3140176 RepID=UPI0038B32AC9
MRISISPGDTCLTPPVGYKSSELLQLIERNVSYGTTQMTATTHSSQLLRLVNQQTLEYASLQPFSGK